MSSKTGRVKFYSNEKGFGFISTRTDGEFFFHITHVLDQLPPNVGDFVTFTPSKDERRGRTYADQVKVVETPKHTSPRTLKDFPCIKGQEIAGFEVWRTFGQVLVGNCDTASDAREALVEAAKSKGANAVFSYLLHRTWQETGGFIKSSKRAFWAEGEAVVLVPECCWTPSGTLKGFPCIGGQEIAGFRVWRTFGQVRSEVSDWLPHYHHATASDARKALVEAAKSKGANAIVNFHPHESREIAFWAEGKAVALVPECSSTSSGTLKGFPCIGGQEIAGFRVEITFGQVRSKAGWFCYHHGTADDARKALVKAAKSKGANAIVNFHPHESREIAFWAEGKAVALVPECSSCTLRRRNYDQ